jgi:hypothetical protein
VVEAAAEAPGREAKRMADRKAYFDLPIERLES